MLQALQSHVTAFSTAITTAASTQACTCTAQSRPNSFLHSPRVHAGCSAMQNLREAIAGYRGRLMHEGNDIKRNALLEVCLAASLLWHLIAVLCAQQSATLALPEIAAL